MRRFTITAVAAATALTLLAACADPGGGGTGDADGDVITLDFETLVWQEGAIAANQEIVDEWNATHPDVQINLIRGSWKGATDKLLTGFEAGTVPDVFHLDSAGIESFVRAGHVLDLEPLLPSEQLADISEGVWDTVRYDGVEGIYGVPFLQEADVIYGNTQILEDVGIELPTMDDPWTWEEFRAIAAELTVDENADGTPEVYGAAVPLSRGGYRTIRLAYGNEGYFFDDSSGSWQVQFGDAERLVPETLHDMIYVDGSISPGDIGLETEEMLPNFFAGGSALLLGESWLRDTMVASQPEGFEWVLLPPVFGTSLNQPSATQTLSVAASSEHPQEAAEFVSFYTNEVNQVKMALGDGLIATSAQALTAPELTTPEHGWDIVSGMGAHLSEAPYQRVAAYDEWSDKVSIPAFDRYYRDEISLEELGRILVEDGNPILDSYRR